MEHIFINIFLLIFYTWITFKFSQYAKHWRTLFLQCKEDTIFLYPPGFKKLEFEHKIKYFMIFFLILCTVILLLGWLEFLKFMMIFIPIFCITFSHSPCRQHILQLLQLNIGHGAALSYYENYLNLFLPYNFLERVKEFESYHKVTVQKKLFILVPQSCKIKPYLDNIEPEFIERCNELPEYEKNVAGIKKRVYNITVYLVKNQNFPEGLRLAIEYAQPLKGLFAFKEKQKISVEDMISQRNLFIASLKTLLKDKNDSNNYCELIDYNDERKVSDVLLERCL